MAEIKPIEVDKYGLAKVSDGRYVNPNYATPDSYRASLINQNPQAKLADVNKEVATKYGLQLDKYGNLPLGRTGDGYGVAYNPVGVAKVINSSVLGSNETPLTIPQVNQSSVAPSLSAISSSVVPQTKAITALEQETAKKAEEEKSFFNRQKERVQNIMQSILGVQGSRSALESEAKIGEKTQKVTDLTNQIEALDRAEQNELRAIQQVGTLSDAQRNAQIRAIQRQYAFQKADLALLQSAANRDLLTAQSIVDRKIQLQLEPLKTQLEFQKMFYDENRDLFTKAEERAFQAKLSADERSYNEQKSFQENKAKILLGAVSQGAPSEVISAINKATDLNEVITAAGVYGGDILERQVKQAQLSKTRMEIAKLANEVESGKPLTGEFGSIVNTTASLVPSNKSKQVKQNLSQALANQDYTTAYAEIANSVEEGLTGTNKTRFASARTDIAVLSGLRDAIQQFADAGGNMGYLKGTADQIAKRFGQLATDPKFAALAIQLEREFQAYRNEMTGAAFTPEESNEYRAVNPRGNATLDLNLATIDGAIAQLTNRVKSTIDERVPGSAKIYDLAFSKAEEINNSTPVGDVQVVNGIKYIKSSDGLYYPEIQNKSTINTSTPTYTRESFTPNFDSFSSLFKFK